MPRSPRLSGSSPEITTTTCGPGPATTATFACWPTDASTIPAPGPPRHPPAAVQRHRCRCATASSRSWPPGAVRPTGVSVVQSYPNLGLVTDRGRRAVILSHGHFIEPLYRMMSLLDTVFGSPRTGAVEAWQLEADNGGWIDFFWSSMGDSGDIMRVTRSLYESLQSHEAMHAEIAAIERAIKIAGPSRAQADVEAHAVAGLFRAGSGPPSASDTAGDDPEPPRPGGADQLPEWSGGHSGGGRDRPTRRDHLRLRPHPQALRRFGGAGLPRRCPSSTPEDGWWTLRSAIRSRERR